MKKIALSALIIATSTTVALAQKRVVLGAQSGFTLASEKVTSQGVSLSTDYSFGVAAGLLAEIRLSDVVFLQPSINYVQKGGEVNITVTTYNEVQNTKVKDVLNYIELPLQVLIFREAGSGYIFGGIGPAFNFALNGTSKGKITTTIEGQTTVENIKQDIKFGGADSFKSFEVTGDLVVGYQFVNGLFVSLNYNFPLSNSAYISSSETSVKNSYCGIRVGYKLGWGKNRGE